MFCKLRQAQKSSNVDDHLSASSFVHRCVFGSILWFKFKELSCSCFFIRSNLYWVLHDSIHFAVLLRMSGRQGKIQSFEHLLEVKSSAE